MIPITKQSAAIRHVLMAIDPKKYAKASASFLSAYKVDLGEACAAAQRTLETTREPV